MSFPEESVKERKPEPAVEPGPSKNLMRREDRTLSEVENMQIQGLKDIGNSFCEACNHIGSSREMSLAKTRMDEAVLWATKHISA